MTLMPHIFLSTFAGLVEKSKLEDCGILQNLETLKNHSNGAVQQRASTVLNQIRNHKL